MSNGFMISVKRIHWKKAYRSEVLTWSLSLTVKQTVSPRPIEKETVVTLTYCSRSLSKAVLCSESNTTFRAHHSPLHVQRRTVIMRRRVKLVDLGSMVLVLEEQVWIIN